MIEESYELMKELQDAINRFNFIRRMLVVQALPQIVNFERMPNGK